MLVYRVIRSPERRVFYIDVGNIPPENVADYLQQAQSSLKRNAVVDKSTGQVDLRYNPLSVDEDYFLPVRGGDTGTRIDSLAGGANTGDIEDVQYIQKKLFSALKIPKAYLGYDEDIGAKATLAQEDIRFSRTIQRIQKVIISELNKIAMIHLYTHGYENEDVMNFELKLSNPSSVAQQQKLELIRTKFDIASNAPEGFVDREWIQKHIFDFTDSEINRIKIGMKKDRIEDIKLEKVQPRDTEGVFGDEEDGGLGKPGGSDSEEESGSGGGGLGGLFSGDFKDGDLLGEEDDNLDKQEATYTTMTKKKKPIKASSSSSRAHSLANTLGNNTADSKIDPAGGATNSGDVLDGGDVIKSINSNLMDNVMPKSRVINDFIDRKMQSMFNNIDNAFGVQKNTLLKENQDNEDILIDMLDKIEEES
jgi:hypothetical protein